MWHQPGDSSLGPTPHVQPKPGDGQSLPRLLLVKPDRTCNEILDGFLAPEKPVRAEMMAEEIETPLDPANMRKMPML